ncbi:Hsp20/alpha crystallin family protein [Lentibacillus cibarius]|uniref:Hsp20/alpha crystallin family protein n=1 Tax=Lentibacillus cibarius TaxID=2583219 RepID=A0A549YJX8_9BACI|nr:Hsp20/alpha crystallin family protein [Lentibacillus cibarius]
MNTLLKGGGILNNNNNKPRPFDVDMSPFRDFMQRMDTFFNQSFKQMNPLFGFRPFWIDVDENDSEIIVKANLQGYKRNQIQLETFGNQLRIIVQNNTEKDAIDHIKGSQYKQQTHQQMDRTITLPFEIPKNETNASFQDGELKVTIPKIDNRRKYINIDE